MDYGWIIIVAVFILIVAVGSYYQNKSENQPQPKPKQPNYTQSYVSEVKKTNYKLTLYEEDMCYSPCFELKRFLKSHGYQWCNSGSILGYKYIDNSVIITLVNGSMYRFDFYDGKTHQLNSTIRRDVIGAMSRKSTWYRYGYWHIDGATVDNDDDGYFLFRYLDEEQKKKVKNDVKYGFFTHTFNNIAPDTDMFNHWFIYFGNVENDPIQYIIGKLLIVELHSPIENYKEMKVTFFAEENVYKKLLDFEKITAYKELVPLRPERASEDELSHIKELYNEATQNE